MAPEVFWDFDGTVMYVEAPPNHLLVPTPEEVIKAVGDETGWSEMEFDSIWMRYIDTTELDEDDPDREDWFDAGGGEYESGHLECDRNHPEAKPFYKVTEGAI
jgi:hypothetical protein